MHVTVTVDESAEYSVARVDHDDDPDHWEIVYECDGAALKLVGNGAVLMNLLEWVRTELRAERSRTPLVWLLALESDSLGCDSKELRTLPFRTVASKN